MNKQKQGVTIIEPADIDDKTRAYLSQFWKLPKKEDVQEVRERLYGRDKFWALEN